MMPCWVVDPTGYSDHQQPPLPLWVNGDSGDATPRGGSGTSGVAAGLKRGWQDSPAWTSPIPACPPLPVYKKPKRQNKKKILNQTIF